MMKEEDRAVGDGRSHFSFWSGRATCESTRMLPSSAPTR
jgi:hypothetical protein